MNYQFDGCLGVDADGRRLSSDSDDSFRPVQGSLVLPTAEEIERVVDDSESAIEDLLAEMRQDWRNLPFLYKRTV